MINWLRSTWNLLECSEFFQSWIPLILTTKCYPIHLVHKLRYLKASFLIKLKLYDRLHRYKEPVNI